MARKKPSAKLGRARAFEPTHRIAIFGGTFDPIHFGHLNSIETVLSARNPDQLWVVPTNLNPLREEAVGPTAQQRLEMVRLGLQSLSHVADRIYVKTDEIERSGKSYTIDTINAFRAAEPTAQFELVIGADQFENFDKWKDYKKLLLETHLVVTTRPGVNLPIDKETSPPWLRREIKNFSADKITLKSGSEILFLKLKDVEASSTEIRRRIRRHDNVSHLVPLNVTEFATNCKFYELGNTIKDFSQLAKFCSTILNDKGGLAVNAYDLREMVQPTEYTIAASGTSTRHTRALCEHVVRETKDRFGIRPQSTEGLQEGRWIIIDYGSLMIHVFYDFVRSEYKIEELWSKAARL